ncbi:MAG: hypothetical protein DCF19_16210 [Pseudanabaena frigida]|uniref:DUF1877 domain-containing protein n=1 Tax=Pseudanabaena frigida TaxID=945775 RepID=A0A2W4W4U4_9CYAN|nr:MAG: hypothetical protein DCF19_16210 [Pseudanabaena frigida]
MGSTLWVLGKNRTTDGDDWDHSALFNAVENLDPICERLGVLKLSTFLDWSDFEANMADDDDEFLDEENLKNKAMWFSPIEALPTLNALRDYLANHETERKNIFEKDLQHFSEDLLEELDDCISKVGKIANEGDTFHFCVVM